MALTIGTQLGSHEITALLGKGGMGEVYRARDTKLKRDVAIKILPDEFSRDSDRVARFQREAEVLASLNHPNIAGIYDLQQTDETRFLVMELVEGETLADRINRGPLPVEEALNIGKSICEALEAAHEKGIVHRDLKPTNVKITPDGGVKVLDFGLAKIGQTQSSAVLSKSPTLLSASMPGMIIGTAAYMSPEQARGRNADHRSDIFSFGCVLYEMLSGKQAFQGDDVSDVLAAVLRSEPDLAALPSNMNPQIRKLLRRCLEKNPKRRWQSIGDLRIEIEDALASPADEQVQAAVPGAVPATSAGVRRQLRLAWAVAAVLLLVSAALAGWIALHRTVPSSPKVAFEIATPTDTSPVQISISPDSKHLTAEMVASEKTNMLWVRALDAVSGIFIPGTEGSSNSFWSPDGRFIAFSADGKLKKVDLLGAPPQTLCEARDVAGGTWNRDSVILFGSNTGPLFRISAAGGIPVQLTELDKSRAEIAHRHPFFLPDGKHFLYVAISNKVENSGIYVGSLDSQERKFLLQNGIKAQFGAGKLLYLRENTLLGQEFDPARLELRGESVRLAEHVGFNPGNSAGGFSVSNTGALLLRLNDQGGNGSNFLRWYDRNGREIAGPSRQGYRNPVISPDLQHLAASRIDASASDIWILDLARGTTTRFTYDSAVHDAPVWSPDGNWIVFQSGVDLHQKNASGVGQEELLLKSDHPKLPVDWSSDGRFLLYRDDDPKTGADLWVLPLTGEKKPVPFVLSPFTDFQGRFSPDSRFIAYTSNESGVFQVYVQGFPNAVNRWQISANGGYHPRWRRDGKELYFVSGVAGGADVMAADISVSPDGALKAGVPHKLFATAPIGLVGDRNTWDVTPGGQRFLMNSAAPAISSGGTPLTVILNWDK
jgi:serine/threonine protein kinase/Tol biopolymer transport system component